MSRMLAASVIHCPAVSWLRIPTFAISFSTAPSDDDSLAFATYPTSPWLGTHHRPASTPLVRAPCEDKLDPHFNYLRVGHDSVFRVCVMAHCRPCSYGNIHPVHHDHVSRRDVTGLIPALYLANWRSIVGSVRPIYLIFVGYRRGRGSHRNFSSEPPATAFHLFQHPWQAGRFKRLPARQTQR